MKVSIIITAWKEHRTIGACIESILKQEFNNIPEDEFELLLVCPDDATYKAAEDKLNELSFNLTQFVYIKDPQKGKPTALQMAFEKASGEILILTDGDDSIGENSINVLVEKLKSDETIGGVSGRPVSADRRSTMFGYWGHLLADAAHHKRTITLTQNKGGQGAKFISNKNFFTLSGYLCAVYKPNYILPADVLADDAYISYKIIENGKRIAYEPEATVFIKYPTNLKDWYNQKSRSLGGYIQLWKYGIVSENNKTRSFWHELEYFWFPLRYARSIKQFIWSLLLYPARLLLWIIIFYERKILKKNFEKSWVRIESTK